MHGNVTLHISLFLKGLLWRYFSVSPFMRRHFLYCVKFCLAMTLSGYKYPPSALPRSMCIKKLTPESEGFSAKIVW